MLVSQYEKTNFSTELDVSSVKKALPSQVADPDSKVEAITIQVVYNDSRCSIKCQIYGDIQVGYRQQVNSSRFLCNGLERCAQCTLCTVQDCVVYCLFINPGFSCKTETCFLTNPAFVAKLEQTYTLPLTKENSIRNNHVNICQHLSKSCQDLLI